MWHVTSAPRDKSCTVSNCNVGKIMPKQLNSRVSYFFKKQKILQGLFFIKKKLQGPKLAIFTGTKCIFKPSFY